MKVFFFFLSFYPYFERNLYKLVRLNDIIVKLWMKHHLYKVLSEINEDSKKKKKSFKAQKEETGKLKRKRRKWKNLVFSCIFSLDSFLLEGKRTCSMVDLSFYWVLKCIVLWFHYEKLGFEWWVILNDNFDLIKC